jgi:hypothetical protein
LLLALSKAHGKGNITKIKIFSITLLKNRKICAIIENAIPNGVATCERTSRSFTDIIF